MIRCSKCSRDITDSTNPYKYLNLGPCCGRILAQIPDGEAIQNNHLVSRFHTKTWEVGQRNLLFYDFEKHKEDEKSSETLLSQSGVNSVEVEKWFNKTFESLNGGFFDKYNRDTQLNQKQVESFLMMFLAQYARLMIKTGIKEYNEAVRSLMNMPSNVKDTLFKLFDDNFDIIPYELDKAFCMNSDGLFPVLYRDESKAIKKNGAMAFPVNKKCVVIVIPKGDISKFNKTLREDGNLISRFSVGIKASKVVFPMEWKTDYKEFQIDLVMKTFRNLNQIQLQEYYDKVGHLSGFEHIVGIALTLKNK